MIRHRTSPDMFMRSDQLNEYPHFGHLLCFIGKVAPLRIV